MTEMERQRMQAEVDKLLAESLKLSNEAIFLSKKARWFEVAVAIAVTAVLVKFF